MTIVVYWSRRGWRKYYFFIRLSKGTNHENANLRNYLQSPVTSTLLETNLNRPLPLLWTSSEPLYSTTLICFLKSPIVVFKQYILKHGSYIHQNTFSSVSIGQVSFLGVCFEVRKINLKWGPFFPSVSSSVLLFVCSFVT